MTRRGRLVALSTRVAPIALLAVGLGVFLVVNSSASTAARMSKEATESAALARMVAALDGVSSSYLDWEGSEAPPGVSSFANEFDVAWAELRALIDEKELAEVDELSIWFNAYLRSVSGEATQGPSSDELERGLRRTMVGIQIEENAHLLESLASLDRAEGQLRFAVPLLLGVATVVAVLIWLLVRRARRFEYIEGVAKAKDELIATVSHELRTPLTAVMAVAYELRDSADLFSTDEIQSFAGILTEQSEELTSLVDDLLVAVRDDATHVPLSTEPLRVNEQIERALASCGAESRIELAGPSDAMVVADALRLRQILRNLVTNALRHGGPDVRVEVRPSPHAVHILVSDDGAGVVVDDVEAVFSPYRQIGLPGEGNPSLGLGLSVSRKLARRMGGEVTYRREGVRTVFDVQLPAAPSPHVAVEPASAGVR